MLKYKVWDKVKIKELKERETYWTLWSYWWINENYVYQMSWETVVIKDVQMSNTRYSAESKSYVFNDDIILWRIPINTSIKITDALEIKIIKDYAEFLWMEISDDILECINDPEESCYWVWDYINFLDCDYVDILGWYTDDELMSYEEFKKEYIDKSQFKLDWDTIKDYKFKVWDKVKVISDSNDNDSIWFVSVINTINTINLTSLNISYWLSRSSKIFIKSDLELVNNSNELYIKCITNKWVWWNTLSLTEWKIYKVIKQTNSSYNIQNDYWVVKLYYKKYFEINRAITHGKQMLFKVKCINDHSGNWSWIKFPWLTAWNIYDVVYQDDDSYQIAVDDLWEINSFAKKYRFKIVKEKHNIFESLYWSSVATYNDPINNASIKHNDILEYNWSKPVTNNLFINKNNTMQKAQSIKDLMNTKFFTNKKMEELASICEEIETRVDQTKETRSKLLDEQDALVEIFSNLNEAVEEKDIKATEAVLKKYQEFLEEEKKSFEEADKK